jgi:hypothetical protein
MDSKCSHLSGHSSRAQLFDQSQAPQNIYMVFIYNVVFATWRVISKQILLRQ